MGNQKVTSLELSYRQNGTPRVVIAGLASCFGCQLQITNVEKHLLDILGQIDLVHWQLASSVPMPEDFDVVVIEGAVTTLHSMETVKEFRKRAKVLIAIGACATTAGIPGLATPSFEGRVNEVYESIPQVCSDMIEPRPISAVVDVDYEVRACPIDSFDFLNVLYRVLYGSNASLPTSTMCGDCKRNENECFYTKGKVCMGLVTRSGCGAKCVNMGRVCNGCRGLALDANLDEIRDVVNRYGVDAQAFADKIKLFNQTDERCQNFVSAFLEEEGE